MLERKESFWDIHGGAIKVILIVVAVIGALWHFTSGKVVAIVLTIVAVLVIALALLLGQALGFGEHEDEDNLG